jgi:WD40 repeat protein
VPFDYKAFISYKHNVSDTFTRRLEQALKSYARPAFARPIRIFRDEKHLTPGVDLPQLIVHALDASEFLVLLASREAARSPWVAIEIDHWCGQLRRTANLIVILIDGDIATDNTAQGVDWTKTDALPVALKPYLDQVPLYVDMRKQVKVDDLTLANPEFKTAVNAMVARFRGVDPNEMLGEEIHQHRRAIRIRNGGIAALAVLTLASMTGGYVAMTQREEARRQTRIAVSRQYAAEATALMESELDEAIFKAAGAVATNDTFEARSVLFRAVTYSPGLEAFLYRSGESERPPVASFKPAAAELALAAAGTLYRFTLAEGGALDVRTRQLAVGTVSTVAHSHNGSLVAIGDEKGQLAVLNSTDWTPVGAPLKLSDQTISRVFFNASDELVFAVSDGKVFRVSVSAGELIPAEPVPIRPPELNAAIRNWTGKPTGRRRGDLTAVTADGRLLATANFRTVVVWDMNDPIREHVSFDVRHQFTVGVREIALSPRGDLLAVDLLPASDGVHASFVQLYSLGSVDGVAESSLPVLRRTFTTAKALDTPTYRLAFDATGSRLLIADRESRFNLVDTRSTLQEVNREINLTGSVGPAGFTGTRRIEVRGLSGTVHSPRFPADDTRILLGVGTRIVLWNTREPDALSRTLITHDRSPTDIAFSPDGSRLLVATSDGAILGWNAREATTNPSSQFATTAGAGIISRDATQVSIASGTELSVRDALTGREIYKTDLRDWKRLAASPDGAAIAVFREGILRVLAVPGFREIWKAQLYDEALIANPPVRDPGVGFSRDGTRMVVHVFASTELTEWDAASGRRISKFDTGAERGWEWAPVMSPDGRWIVTAATSRSLTIVDTVTRGHETLDVRPNVCAVAFSPDSTRVAIAYERDEMDADDTTDGRSRPADYGILFWTLDAKRWDPQHIKVPSPPCHVTFSTDGQRLAIATTPEDDEHVQVSMSELTPARWAQIALAHIAYKPQRK